MQEAMRESIAIMFISFVQLHRAKLHASSINQPAEFQGVLDDNLLRGSEDTLDLARVGSTLKVDVCALNWPSIAVRIALPRKPALEIGSCLRIASSAYTSKKTRSNRPNLFFFKN